MTMKLAAFAAALLLLPCVAPATTVEPVTFDMLVRDADRIRLPAHDGDSIARARRRGQVHICRH